MDVAVGADAHALITTPGAGKWYRSAGRDATQQSRFEVGPNAVMEWLPQETIIFDGARAALAMQVNLADDAVLHRLGGVVPRPQRRRRTFCYRDADDGDTHQSRRQALVAGARTPCRRLTTRLPPRRVWRDSRSARPCSLPSARLALSCLNSLRAASAADGVWGVTFLPQLMVARYLGPSAQAARDYFCSLWQVLRPALAGRDAAPPRIWNT